MANSKSKSDNQTQYIETIESWFSDAQELAVNLLMLRQWRWHTRKVSIQAGDSPKQKRDLIRQLQKELDSRVDETEQQIEFLASKSQSLKNRFAEIWPGLKLAYCDLGDFHCEGLPAGRCGWVALQSLTERVMGWGKYLANEQQKRTLNCQEQAEFIERERWLSGVVDSIRARLLLEESKLLTPPPLVLSSSRARLEKKINKGGVESKYSAEQLRQFKSWWDAFVESRQGKRPTSEGFIEWGEEHGGIDFPTEIREIKSLKRALRYSKGKTQRQNKSKR
jgi:hypothetical protein